MTDNDFDDFDDDFRDDEFCPDCDGEGWKVVCVDDMCVGQGWCMHGDGDRPCPTCNGHGDNPLFPEALPRDAVARGWKPAPEAP